MLRREEVEKMLADLGRQRRDAEAEAAQAAERLARLAGGLTPLPEVDGEQVRAAADTFGDNLQRLRLLEAFARDLRGLLM